jgi:ribA/ribD-fused uncharacterized protein
MSINEGESNVLIKARLFSERSSPDTMYTSREGELPLTIAALKKLLQEALDSYGIDSIKTSLESIKTEFKEFKSSFNFTHEVCEEAKAIAEQCMGVVHDLKTEVDSLKAELAAEKGERQKMACHEHRSNLRLYGFREEDRETDTQKERKIRIFLHDQLGMQTETWGDLPIERCHRMGARPRDSRKVFRPINVKFSFFKDRQFIWRNKQKMAGSNVYVKEDFPIEIDQRVNVMMPIFKAAKRDKDLKVSLVIDKLFINNTLYTVETLDRLPDKIKPENLATRTEENIVCFYRKESGFSNFHPAKQEEGGISYNCNEQYLTANKAKLFKDEEALKTIMESDNPAVQKSVKVKNYDHQVWMGHAKEVMKKGVKLKFEQNTHLKKMLFDTGSKIIVEASPRDAYWGAGIGMNNRDILDRSKWGENNLGKILMQVRSEL